MTLDNPALAGRLKTISSRRSSYERRAVVSVRPRLVSDVRLRPAAATTAAKPAPTSKPAKPAPRRSVHSISRRPAHSAVLKREIVPKPGSKKTKKSKRSLRSKVPMALAAILFVFGLGVGINGLHTTHKVAAQVRQMSAATDSGGGTAPAATTDVPSETKPTGGVAGYQVAPTMPRLLVIPKLGVQARVLRTTVNSKNELGTPSNVFDTAWYDGSAKPGEAGAVLIDGHVSGPTQNGVFYGLKTLKPGDKIQLERGDGKQFSYTVVTSKVYDANNVDMAAAMTPITPGKAGLNLITCTGKIDSSGSHFQQRIVVFAAQD